MTHGRKVALVIEDERHVARLLVQMLSNLGFAASDVATADAADAFLQTHPADLILLDLRLQGRSGDDWLISFRKRNHETPVMAVSSVADPARRAAVLRDGADSLINKPFDVTELEAHVCALLRRPRIAGERTICDGLVSLNPARSELRVGDVHHVLTQREFQILWCLAIHEGSWVAAASLAASVLGDASESNIESIRVHVFNLRQKMTYLSDHFQIESARKMGYRIVK